MTSIKRHPHDRVLPLPKSLVQAVISVPHSQRHSQ